MIEKSDRVGLPAALLGSEGRVRQNESALPIRSPSGESVSPLSTMLSMP